MKKVVLGLALALLIGICSANAYEYSPKVLNDIKEGQQVEYSPITKSWTRDYSVNNMIFTKYITHGSGSYSEYKNKNTYYGTNTTYEFLFNDKLIGYSMHLLKFYNLQFVDNKFVHNELTEAELKELFPNVEFIKVSDFKNDKIVVKKPKNKTVTYMLINDTRRDFYKYQFEKYNNDNELIRGVFEASKPMKLTYSHFGSRDKMFPILQITVKNSRF